jgi:hypothetical protein
MYKDEDVVVMEVGIRKDKQNLKICGGLFVLGWSIIRWGGVLVQGFQVDIGSSVNFMNMETMEELRLTNMVPTSIILKMADHTCTRSLGQLLQVPVQIAGQEYKIDFVVFRITDAIQPIPILERPWLIIAKAKEDWGKWTFTLGKGNDKMVLPLFPTRYQGETQDEGTKFTTEGYETKSEDTPI